MVINNHCAIDTAQVPLQKYKIIENEKKLSDLSVDDIIIICSYGTVS